MKREKTEEQIRKKMLEIQTIMEEVENDPEVAQAAEEAQRELGTLTPEELRKPICDFTTPLFDISMRLKKKWDAEDVLMEVIK